MKEKLLFSVVVFGAAIRSRTSLLRKQDQYTMAIWT
jgi:hypothetical protein